MGRTTHYSILGVEPDATAAQIKRAYRALAKVHHPDVSAAADSAKQFAKLAAAYETLSDPAARRAYDQSLREPKPAPKGHPAHDPRPHYTWTNIAAQGVDEAIRANREHEIDELYDTFFARTPRPEPVRKKPASPAAGKKPRTRRRTG